MTDFKSNKVRALLAYLAVERDAPQHRDVLAGLLWPRSTNESALALLRDALSDLRRILGDRDRDTPIVRVQGDTLQIDPSVLWMDVVAFSESAAASSEEELEQVVMRYRGDFLEGFSLSGCLDFEDWVLLRREAFRRIAMDSLYRLTTSYLQRGDYAAAQATARRQLKLDGYSEEAHRQLLRALALDGKRNHALAHYADYRALLKEELDVAPDVRTTALYQRIRAGDLRPGVASDSSLSTGHAGAVDGRASGFVGRTAELARLEDALHRAQQGAGQVVFVTGEAGSGKTMLLQAFARRVLARSDDVVMARGTCNAQVGAGDPYLPFREILRLLTGDFDVPGDGGALEPAHAQRLEAFAPTMARALADLGPDLIGGLVPVSPALAEWARMSPTVPSPKPQSPAALCDQVTRVLREVASSWVLVLVLDDLHWADRGTLNLLAHLGRRLSGSRILLVGVYRPGEVAPDGALSSIVHELQRTHGDVILDLDRASGRDFVGAYLDRVPNALDEPFRAQLARQTGGNALFTAALVQQLQDDGILVTDSSGCWIVDADLNWSRLPPRVEAVIAQRLARLPEKWQNLLAVASVQGEVFAAEIVAHVLDQDPAAVLGELRALGEGALVGSPPNLVYALDLERVGDRRVARYRFRHALFQQYLYTQLDDVRRTALHEAVGYALEALYAGHLDRVALQLAYHFEAADLLEPAVDYLLQAGKQAYRLSGPAESAALYQRGLVLLERLPESTQRDRRELELRLNQEATLMSTRGWGAPERAASLRRAYLLGQRLGETQRLLPVLQALASTHIAQADYPAALACAEQLLTLTKKSPYGLYRMMGRRMMGTGHFFLGHYAQARECLEAGLHAYEALAAEAEEADYILVVEEGIRLHVWLPHVLLPLGYPTQAVAFSREALARANALGYVGAQAIALTTAGAAFHAIGRQPEAARHYAGQLLALATKHGLPAYQGWGAFYRGWALAYQGQPSTGLPEMHAGLKQIEATGTQTSFANLFTLLAEIYARNGQIRQGDAALNRALTHAEQAGARAHLAEMYRVQGVLKLEEQAVEEAEASFERAIEIAQDQAVKLWELRAVVDLARLWEMQGRVAEAYARLSEIYDWFTEGANTPDLVAAWRLLENFRTSSDNL